MFAVTVGEKSTKILSGRCMIRYFTSGHNHPKTNRFILGESARIFVFKVAFTAVVLHNPVVSQTYDIFVTDNIGTWSTLKVAILGESARQ